MGDMGDYFRDWDAYKRELKAARLQEAQSIAFNAMSGIPDWTKHTPYHWSRILCGDRMDYWPSTGKWRWRNKSYRGTPYNTARFIANREIEAEAALGGSRLATDQQREAGVIGRCQP